MTAHAPHDRSDPDQQIVNDLLNEWDFIGVADELPEGMEEYDCLVAPLLRRLRAGEGPTELESYLNVRLAEHFGLDGPSHGTAEFARRLHGTWAARQ